MFRKILVASDLTDASIPALKTALDVARRFAASVVVVHVAEAPYQNRRWYAPFEQSETELLEALRVRHLEAAGHALEEQVEKAREGGADGVDIKTVVRDGVPADAIPGTAVDIGADLIVMGTHGRKGAHHLLLGSIAERVVRISPVPVLTVRPGEN